MGTHESDEEDNSKGTVFGNIITVIMLFTLAVVIFWAIDVVALNGKYFNKVLYPPNCTYQVPEGFKIVYSAEEKKYSVAVFDKVYGTKYLYNGRNGIDDMYYEIAHPSTFDDSCAAKGYLQAYIMQSTSSFK